jgi:hypothetical protein
MPETIQNKPYVSSNLRQAEDARRSRRSELVKKKIDDNESSARQSDFSRETERKVERILAELYDLLQIRRPDDLFGSIVIETRYQNGRPVGQVDVNIRYVMKRSDREGKNER